MQTSYKPAGDELSHEDARGFFGESETLTTL